MLVQSRWSRSFQYPVLQGIVIPIISLDDLVWYNLSHTGCPTVVRGQDDVAHLVNTPVMIILSLMSALLLLFLVLAEIIFFFSTGVGITEELFHRVIDCLQLRGWQEEGEGSSGEARVTLNFGMLPREARVRLSFWMLSMIVVWLLFWLERESRELFRVLSPSQGELRDRFEW